MFTLNRPTAAKVVLAFASPRKTYKIPLVLRCMTKLFYCIFYFLLSWHKRNKKSRRNDCIAQARPHRVSPSPRATKIRNCLHKHNSRSTTASQRSTGNFCDYWVSFSKSGRLMLTFPSVWRSGFIAQTVVT